MQLAQNTSRVLFYGPLTSWRNSYSKVFYHRVGSFILNIVKSLMQLDSFQSIICLASFYRYVVSNNLSRFSTKSSIVEDTSSSDPWIYVFHDLYCTFGTPCVNCFNDKRSLPTLTIFVYRSFQ